MRGKGAYHNEPRRMAVLIRSGLGDAVYVIPALRALRTRYPEAEIEVVVREHSFAHRMLERCPYKSAFLLRVKRGWESKKLLIRHLRQARYDTALMLGNSEGKAFYTWLAGIPRRIGGVKNFLSRLFLTDPVEMPHNSHQINDLFKKVVEKAGCDVSEWRFELFARPEAQLTAEAKLQEVGWRPELPLVGIHPGAGKTAPNKEWFPEGFAVVADALLKQGVQVLLMGGTGEQEAVQQILESMQGTPFVLTGKLDLDELVFCSKKLSALVSNDSGPAHVASAVGTPTVLLFGPTKAVHYAPFMSPCIAIDRSHLCSSRCNFRTCHRKNRLCMRSISPEEVIRAVFQLIEAHERPQQVEIWSK